MTDPNLNRERSNQWKKKNRGRHAALARAYRRRNPEKLRAQNQLNYAVRKGEIERGPCEKCGTTERVHGHHHDYSKPFDVRWLCHWCHKAEHPVTEAHKVVKFDGAKHAQLPGHLNPNASLTAEQVEEIELLLHSGLSQQRIADRYGVNQTTVSRIKLGKRYG